ncbi:hypothetical protein AAFC00_003577 [Neodothiora populina]|uniref:Aquaporin-like protein n=1 Tax=Neodothiora populina TaxID=2781224 RepID=A0ABR3PEV4_9PEZI
MESERPPQRPGLSHFRQRTVSSLGPRTTQTSTNHGGSYSLAGPQDRGQRQPPRHGTYVEEGYRDLNPEYERTVHNPVFSLAGNQPHTVRGFMKRQNSDAKARPVGKEGAQKGETETPPQLQNIEGRNNTDRTQEPATPGSYDANDGPAMGPESPGVPGGNIRMRTATAHHPDGRPLGTIGEEVQFSPSDDDAKTLAPDDNPDDRPFNPWAGIRRKFQDPLGEWLGTTILIAIGVGSNLQVATSDQQNTSYQTIYWAWGLATMLGIYVSGGSSGAHLNPALSIMLSVWRGFPARRVPIYILAQLLGAFTGALIAIAIYRDAILHLDGALIPMSTGVSIYTQPKEWVRPATAFFTEAVGTGLLSLGIIALGDDANSPPGAGMHAFIIGLLVSLLLMAFEQNTGAAFNPVRDLGPRLAAMVMGYPTSIFDAGNAWWIWGAWGATITGSLLGVGVYDLCIFKGGESPVNYSSRRWRQEGLKAEAGWFSFLGERNKVRDVETKLENGGVV